MLPIDYENHKTIHARLNKASGYLYFMDKDHPLASKIGVVSHHRHVAYVALGRWLKEDEVVHHKDGVRDNNDPNNLLVTSVIGHAKAHSKERLKNCLHCGASFHADKAWSKYCSTKCWSVDSRKLEIDPRRLRSLVETEPLTSIAARYNVSSVAVKKRCKLLGIPTKPRGFWAKHKAATSRQCLEPR